MSSASIFVSSRTSTAASRAAPNASGAGTLPLNGWVSRMSRWRVHEPPFSTFDGTPGSGVSEPNFPPPPANWNAVT